VREIEKVGLERAILHQVDAGPSGLRISGRELPLDDSPKLAEFLAGHIRNGLKDSQTRAAKWPPQVTPAEVPATCQALLEGTLDLIAASSPGPAVRGFEDTLAETLLKTVERLNCGPLADDVAVIIIGRHA